MKKINLYLSIAVIGLLLNSCSKKDIQPGELGTKNEIFTEPQIQAILVNSPETFESGTKTAYAGATVSLSSGNWYMNDALIGTSASDPKNGTKSVRIREIGKVTMQFDVTNGATSVIIKHAKYGSDASSTWELWMSTNSGSSYTKVGSTITTSSTSLQTATFNL